MRSERSKLLAIAIVTIVMNGLASLTWAHATKLGPLYEAFSSCACCSVHEWTCVRGYFE